MSTTDRFSQFIRDKFEVLLLFTLVIIIFTAWVRTVPDVNSIKEVLMFVLGAMTALMRIVPRPTQNIQTENVQAENIEAATTKEGDINLSDSADTKLKKE